MSDMPPTDDIDFRDPALSGLYRKHSQAEPPVTLDDVILARARQALTPGPTRKSGWWRRLSAPVALAATVVLAVLVSLHVEQQPPGFIPPPVVDEQPPAPVETRQPTPPVSGKNLPIPSRQQQKAEAGMTAKRDSHMTTTERKAIPTPFPAARPAGKERLNQSPLSAEHQRSRPIESFGTAPANRSDGSSGISPARSRSAVREEAKSIAGEQQTETRALRERLATPDPESWLEEIRRLRRQGRMHEADQSLARFRRAYPDHPLPEDLRRSDTGRRP